MPPYDFSSDKKKGEKEKKKEKRRKKKEEGGKERPGACDYIIALFCSFKTSINSSFCQLAPPIKIPRRRPGITLYLQL